MKLRNTALHSRAPAGPWTLDLSCSPTASVFTFGLKEEVRVTSPSQILPMTVQPACFSPWTGPQRSGVNAPVRGFVSGLMNVSFESQTMRPTTASESLFYPCVRTCEEITPSTPDLLSGCDVRWETRMSLIIKMEGRSNLAAGSSAVQSFYIPQFSPWIHIERANHIQTGFRIQILCENNHFIEIIQPYNNYYYYYFTNMFLLLLY